MTHDKLMEKVDAIFAIIKRRDALYFSNRKFAEMTPSEQTELRRHFLDIERAVGIANDDYRQWSPGEIGLALLMLLGGRYHDINRARGEEMGIYKERDEALATWREENADDLSLLCEGDQ
jgi:hypothetical protein